MKKFKSCMLVDDEVELVDALRDSLESLFEKVDTCGDGKQALEKIVSDNYDLIVSDIQMPNMKGDELLNQLRIKGIRTPFVYITGNGSRDFYADRRMGVVEFVEKPFNFGVFLEKVERVMEIELTRKEFKKASSIE